MNTSSRDRRPSGRLTVLAVFLGGCSLVALSCFKIPDAPVLPTWDVQLSVPLVDSIYYLRDALHDNPDMIASETSYVYHPINLPYDPLSIGDQLHLSPPNPTSQAQDSLGGLAINTPGSINFVISPISILGGPHTVGTPIDSFQRVNNAPAPPISQFEYAHCASGNINISVHNSLPVTINMPGGVVIRNTTSQDIVASFPPFSIPAHTTWVPSPASLAGKTVRKDLTFEATYTSPGSGGVNVDVPADSGLGLLFALTDGIADEVQALSFQRTLIDTAIQQWLLDDSTYIREVTFRRGQVSIHLENQVGVNLKVHFQFNEFRNAVTDQPFAINHVLAPHSPYDTTINLPDWAIKGSGQMVKSATFGLSIATDTLASGSLVTVRSSDYVLARIASSDTLFIHSLSGVLKPFPFTVDATSDIPLGNIPLLFSADSVALQSILMALQFITAAGHPIDFNLMVNGLDDGGHTVASMVMPPRRLLPSVLQTITLSDTVGLSQFISRFITHRPAKINLVGGGIINPPDNYDLQIHDPVGHPPGVITDTTNFYYFLTIDAPLRVAIFNGSFTDTVSFGDTVGTGGKIDKNMLTSVRRATMSFSVVNAMGLGVSLQTKLLDATGATILTVPKSGADSISVPAGTPESPDTTKSPITVRLDPSDADLFGRTQHILVRLGVNSGGTMVKFKPGNYVRVRASAILTYHVDTNK